MKPSIDWPSCEVLGFRRVAPRIVEVRALVPVHRWLWWGRKKELALRVRLSATSGRWFWDESGVQLVLCPGHIWAGLHEALGLDCPDVVGKRS